MKKTKTASLTSLKSLGFSPLSARHKVMNNADMVPATCHAAWLFFFYPNICSNRDLFFCSRLFDFIFEIRLVFLSVDIDKMHHPAHQHDLKQKSL